MSVPYGFSEEDFTRVARSVRRSEGLPPRGDGQLPRNRGGVGAPHNWIRISSATPVNVSMPDGSNILMFPAIWSYFDSNGAGWTDTTNDVWFLGANGETPVANTRYECHCLGADANGQTIWGSVISGATGFWARIVSPAAGQPADVYDFQEVYDPNPPNVWTDVLGGRTGLAEEVNNGTDVPTNALVWMWPNPFKDGWYAFSGVGPVLVTGHTDLVLGGSYTVPLDSSWHTVPSLQLMLNAGTYLIWANVCCSVRTNLPDNVTVTARLYNSTSANSLGHSVVCAGGGDTTGNYAYFGTGTPLELLTISETSTIVVQVQVPLTSADLVAVCEVYDINGDGSFGVTQMGYIQLPDRSGVGGGGGSGAASVFGPGNLYGANGISVAANVPGAGNATIGIGAIDGGTWT